MAWWLVVLVGGLPLPPFPASARARFERRACARAHGASVPRAALRSRPAFEGPGEPPPCAGGARPRCGRGGEHPPRVCDARHISAPMRARAPWQAPSPAPPLRLAALSRHAPHAHPLPRHAWSSPVGYAPAAGRQGHARGGRLPRAVAVRGGEGAARGTGGGTGLAPGWAGRRRLVEGGGPRVAHARGLAWQGGWGEEGGGVSGAGRAPARVSPRGSGARFRCRRAPAPARPRPQGFTSLKHTEADVDATLAAAKRVFARI